MCAGRAYSLRDVLKMAENLTRHTLEVRVNPAFVRPNEVPKLLGSRQKLQQYVDLSPDPRPGSGLVL